MYIRWNRRQLLTNRQVGEYLCPHVRIEQPWTIAPILVHKWPNGRTTTIWNPGPNIRECCLEEASNLAIAAWWWEAKQRFQDLLTYGLPDQEITKALLEQLDIIESIIEDRIQKPTKIDWQNYEHYREDLCITRRRVRVPPYVRQLGLSWPFTKEELSKRWGEIALVQHPDRGGNTAVFQEYIKAYKVARKVLERESA